MEFVGLFLEFDELFKFKRELHCGPWKMKLDL